MSQVKPIRLADYVRRENPFVTSLRLSRAQFGMIGFIVGLVVGMALMVYLTLGIVTR